MSKPVEYRGKSRGATGIGVGGDKGINASPIPIERTIKRRKPEPVSLLDFLGVDSTTYVRALIDTSGSMDNSIPAINVAIDDLRELLKTNIWNGDETKLNKYFDRVDRTNERWVNWVSEDLRDSPSEPDKTVFLVWENEADPVYHSRSDGSATTELNNHIDNFISVYNNSRLFFKCLIFGINTGHGKVGFQEHLENIRFGTGGVNNKLTPDNYNVNIFRYIDPAIEPQFYYDAMLGKVPPL